LDAEGAHLVDEGVDDGAGLFGVRVNFAIVFFVAGDVVIGEPLAEGGVVHVAEGGGEEAAVAAELFDEEIDGAGVGEVAASAAADEDLDAGLGIFFEDGDAEAGGAGARIEGGLGGGDGGHHAGGTGAEDCEVVVHGWLCHSRKDGGESSSRRATHPAGRIGAWRSLTVAVLEVRRVRGR